MLAWYCKLIAVKMTRWRGACRDLFTLSELELWWTAINHEVVHEVRRRRITLLLRTCVTWLSISVIRANNKQGKILNQYFRIPPSITQLCCGFINHEWCGAFWNFWDFEVWLRAFLSRKHLTAVPLKLVCKEFLVFTISPARSQDFICVRKLTPVDIFAVKYMSCSDVWVL